MQQVSRTGRCHQRQATRGRDAIIHGRFPDNGRPRAWIGADVCRIADGVLAEHWGVLQEEAIKAESRSGLRMFAGYCAN